MISLLVVCMMLFTAADFAVPVFSVAEDRAETSASERRMPSPQTIRSEDIATETDESTGTEESNPLPEEETEDLQNDPEIVSTVTASVNPAGSGGESDGYIEIPVEDLYRYFKITDDENDTDAENAGENSVEKSESVETADPSGNGTETQQTADTVQAADTADTADTGLKTESTKMELTADTVEQDPVPDQPKQSTQSEENSPTQDKNLLTDGTEETDHSLDGKDPLQEESSEENGDSPDDITNSEPPSDGKTNLTTVPDSESQKTDDETGEENTESTEKNDDDSDNGTGIGNESSENVEENTVIPESPDKIPETSSAGETADPVKDDIQEELSLMADSLTYGDLTYTVNNNEVTITDCDPGVTSVTIPAQINGMNVVAIGNYAFDGCSNLTNLTIPEGVESLGHYLIRGTAISSITVPSTVTSSGYYASGYYNGALAGCTTLKEVIFAQGATVIPAYICASNNQTSYIERIVIPDSVTSIGNYAFYKCASLREGVDIPRNTRTIGYSAFQGCTSLTEVTMNYNDTVEWSGSIGDYAFADCISLSDVRLAGSYKELGNYLFSGCSSLRNLTIPEGVKSLGYYLIRGTAISSITVPSTVTSSGYYASGYYNGALAGCTTLSEVIFTQGTMAIPSYICASNSQTSYIEKVYIPPTVQSVGQYAFYKCDNMAIYCADGSYAHQYAIENNIPFVLGDFDYGTGSSEPSEPGAVGAIRSVNMTRGGNVYNLLTVKQSFEKGSSDTASITVTVDWGDSSEGMILLSQSGEKYMQAANGNFGSFAPGKYFEAGEVIYAIAVDAHGNTLESKRLNLYITEPELSGEIGGDHSFGLFDAVSFTVPEDKPVLGNQSFNLDFGLISADVELDAENGTFKAALGVNFEKNDDGKFDAAEFTSFKSMVKDMRQNILAGATVASIANGLRKGGYGNTFHVKIKSGWEPDAAICGYVEGKLENGAMIPTEGGIIASAALEYSYEGQAFIVVVPVYYTIGAGGEISLSANVKNVAAGSGFAPVFEGNVEIAPYFEIGGGVGVVYIGQVGARGKATLSFNIALDRDYTKVDLTGQAYFDIKALGFISYEREFANGTWTIYETGRNTLSLASEPEDIYSQIDIYAPAVPEDRSYADNPSEWLGEEQVLSFAADYTNKEVRVLQSNAYPDAEPQIMDVNGTKVMVWLTDNTSRTDENKSMLVYSVYIEDYDTWSAPKAILDNGMADYYPVAKDGYVVWQKAAETFGKGVSLAEVAKNTEIYIVKFEGTSFGTPVRLTNNGILDTQPQVAVSENEVTVVWTENSENNIFGYTGRNSIYRKTYDGQTWSEAELLADGLNTVAYLAVGYMNGSCIVAYSLDGDNDLNTVNDREIYLIRNGRTERFTENATLDSHPVFEKINGSEALFWYSDNNVYYVTDLDNRVLNTISADGILQLTDEYSVLSNGNNTAILWTTVEDGVSEIHGALYDGSQWSDDIEITQEGQSVRYPAGVIEENGDLMIAFNRIQNVADGDYYRDGRADLCIIRVRPSYDLSIENVILADGLKAGAELPLYLTVKNTGELPVTQISADVFDTDGSRSGHFDLDQILQPGETAEFELSYTAGSTVSPGEIRVKISTADGSEYDLENNEAKIAIGQGNLEIVEVTDNAEGDLHTVSVKIRNSGYETAENISVSLREESENGRMIAQKQLDTLASQKETVISFEVDANSLSAEYSFITLAAGVSSDTEESSYGDNSAIFTIERGSQSPDKPVIEEGKYSIGSLTVQNDSGQPLEGIPESDFYVNAEILRSEDAADALVVLAAYDQNGKMLSVRCAKTPSAEEGGTVNIRMENPDGEVAEVRAFVLRSLGMPVALCPAVSVG